MATYKYRQNFFEGADVGYVQYNITPDFGTVVSVGESIEITGKVYSKNFKLFGLIFKAAVAESSPLIELGRVEKTCSKGGTATFSIQCSVTQELANTATSREFNTIVRFLLAKDAAFTDFTSTVNKDDHQMCSMLQYRLPPVINSVNFTSGLDTSYDVFGAAVQGKSDLIVEVNFAPDPLDNTVETKEAHIYLLKNGQFIEEFNASGDAITGDAMHGIRLHIGTAKHSGEFEGYKLELTDNKGETGEYTNQNPFTVYPYSSPRLERNGSRELAERYETVKLPDNTLQDRLSADGTMLWANFKANVSPIGGMNVWSVRSRYRLGDGETAGDGEQDQWSEIYTFPDQDKNILFEHVFTEDKNVFLATNEFSALKRYTVEIEVRDYFETALLRFTVEKAGGYFSIEKYGVAAGMRSTGTAKKPKFESAYPIYPYKGIAMCPEAVAEIPLELDASGKFRLYKEETSPFCLMRYGNIVYLDGEITPASSITGNAEEHIIATLPEDFAPKYSRTYLCQGTGTALWMLRVYAADNEEYPSKITFGRYRSGGSYANCAAGNWLPVSVSWICGGTVVQEGDIEVKFTVSADGTATITGVELTVNANGDAIIPMEYLSVQDGAAVIG